MYGYIYETTCKVNGKKYIGKHKATEFTTKYIGSGKALCNAIRKYGRANFEVRFLESCESLDDLNDRERFWIEFTNACNSDEYYNIRWGGDGGDIALYLPEQTMVQIHKNHSDYIKTRLEIDKNFYDKFAGAKHGHICYQSTRDKIREKRIQYWNRISEEEKHRILSKSATTRCTGRIWLTDDLVDKFVLPNEVESLKAQGFRLGRRFQHRNRKSKKR